MSEKIIIYGQFLKVKKTIDQQAPNDRRETVVVSGAMRSPSDGYHTFEELYNHRITLFIALCRNISDILGLEYPGKYKIWRSKKHSDGEICFGTGTQFVLGIGEEKGQQITYHIPVDRWDETDFAETLDCAPEWDNHTSDDVLERLKNL